MMWIIMIGIITVVGGIWLAVIIAATGYGIYLGTRKRKHS